MMWCPSIPECMLSRLTQPREGPPLRRYGVDEDAVVVGISDVEFTVRAEHDVLGVGQGCGTAASDVAAGDGREDTAVRFIEDDDLVVVAVSDREQSGTVRRRAVGIADAT